MISHLAALRYTKLVDWTPFPRRFWLFLITLCKVALISILFTAFAMWGAK